MPREGTSIIENIAMGNHLLEYDVVNQVIGGKQQAGNSTLSSLDLISWRASVMLAVV